MTLIVEEPVSTLRQVLYIWRDQVIGEAVADLCRIPSVVRGRNMAEILVLDAMPASCRRPVTTSPSFWCRSSAGMAAPTFLAEVIDRDYVEGEPSADGHAYLLAAQGCRSCASRKIDYLAGHRLDRRDPRGGWLSSSRAPRPPRLSVERYFKLVAEAPAPVATGTGELDRPLVHQRRSGICASRRPRSIGWQPIGSASGSQEVVFVDDRLRNLDAAKAVGFNTVTFDIRDDAPEHPHRRIRQLNDLT